MFCLQHNTDAGVDYRLALSHFFLSMKTCFNFSQSLFIRCLFSLMLASRTETHLCDVSGCFPKLVKSVQQLWSKG